IGKPAALRFSHDGKLLAVHSSVGADRIWLWDVATGKPHQTIRKQGTYVANIAFAPDDGKVYFTENEVVKAVNVKDRAPAVQGEPFALENALARVSIARVSEDGLLLAARGH